MTWAKMMEVGRICSKQNLLIELSGGRCLYENTENTDIYAGDASHNFDGNSYNSVLCAPLEGSALSEIVTLPMVLHNRR